jgi:hypothetical protein
MGTTPNRGYPYPDLGDPMAMTTDLQALAEAYDTDLKNVQDSVQQRPMFRASASAVQAYGLTDPSPVSFDLLETMTGGALLDGPGTSMPRTTFIPLIPGLWCFTATVTYPQWLGIIWSRIQLLATTEVASSTTTVMPNTADGNRTLSVTGMQYMSGTGVGTPIGVRFWANSAAFRANMPLYSRSLTGFLVSAS